MCEQRVPGFRLPGIRLHELMKTLILLLVPGLLVLILASCTSNRRYGWSTRPYGVYSSSVYADAPGGWDIYRSGSSTRVKYTD